MSEGTALMTTTLSPQRIEATIRAIERERNELFMSRTRLTEKIDTLEDTLDYLQHLQARIAAAKGA